jgi:hypothetical protein
MADNGYIDFQVSVPMRQPVVIYFNQPSKRKFSLGWMVVLMVAVGLAVWGVLTLSFSIESSCDKITYELQREHEEEMQKSFWKHGRSCRL